MTALLTKSGTGPLKRQSIGEFEQLVLLSILRLRPEAYGIPILDEIQKRTGRSVRRAAVYVALHRLEEKGLVRSRLGDPRPERGGRARKYYEVEAAGKVLLRESRAALLVMWKGIEPQLNEP